MATVSLNRRPGGFRLDSNNGMHPVMRTKRVFEYRRILKILVVRDLKVRYSDSALGYLWTVLDPLLMSFVYFFVFTKVFHRGSNDEDPFILFLVMGQLTWAWFNGGVSGCSRALRAEAQMVRSTNVPRELWVVRVICSKAVEYMFSLPVLAIFALVYLKRPNHYILLMPVAWVLMFFLLVGIGLILAPINVLVRDTDRVIPIVLRVFFYMSPVLYSIQSVRQTLPAIAPVYEYNPVAAPLSLIRAGFYPKELRWDYVWHSVVTAVVLFVIGLYTFTRLERQVLKEL